MIAANPFEVVRVEVAFDHRPVAQDERIAIDGDQMLPDPVAVRVGDGVEGVDHRGMSHRGFTFTSEGLLRSIRIGFRSGRPKPMKLITMTSPSSSFKRSLKLNKSAPKKCTCASPGRRCSACLK